MTRGCSLDPGLLAALSGSRHRGDAAPAPTMMMLKMMNPMSSIPVTSSSDAVLLSYCYYRQCLEEVEERPRRTLA